ELPSSARTIVAAPTSIAVFVGYTHPYKTLEFGIPVQLFSFADYERHFGGLSTSGVFDHTVAHSVNQFFLNGGTNAYVVGLQSEAVGLEADPAQSVKAPFATFADNGAGKAIEIVAKEPTDQIPMNVTLKTSAAIAGDAD